MKSGSKHTFLLMAVVLVVAVAFWQWQHLRDAAVVPGNSTSSGRISRSPIDGEVEAAMGVANVLAGSNAVRRKGGWNAVDSKTSAPVATASASSPLQSTSFIGPAWWPNPGTLNPLAPLSNRSAEAAGTGAMIAAHASLREPAVADPNSPENRVVLQTMLSKALRREGYPPPPK